ncbi:sterol desaturase family protein [Fulvivirgaceae bacterium BMA10]|uniref:Sterol desaturase family protein n=1 Tax=Splendidivirga corallicola TaxID=3051826 RepID=A0ABT8KTH6_9BACT|nr:sterol desaturase family protein [Fulvivirgaceae bacterium BMA10]
MLINIVIVVGTFFFMEGVAWFTHKYIMHGFLWSWHKSHHSVHKHALERNDLFALVFSLPAITLMFIGTFYENLEILFYFGVGVTAYGIFYFIFHDVIVHRRIKINFKAKSRYLRRIMRAHYVHHEKHTKEGCEAFGFLYAPKKYEKETS